MGQSFTSVPFVDLQWQHQRLGDELTDAINRVVTQGDFVLGAAVGAFETAFAQACGAAYGVGVGSGTDALTLGLTACGIGAGDEVLLPANTFVATLIAVKRTGAKPVLVDCDPATALIDLTAAAHRVTARTRAIVPVHLYGQMVSPRQLLQFAQRHNLMIFEDAAQAHLAERDGYRAGTVGMGAAFSFYPSKNLGSMGDGGMLVTTSDIVQQTVRALRNYGAAQKYHHTQAGGLNSRLDTLQAAILHCKLPHLRAWNRWRQRLARRYDQRLAPLESLGLAPLANQSGDGHVYHLYVVRVSPERAGTTRHELQQVLQSRGIQTGIHYPIPCHLQPAFQDLGYGPGDFPQAEALCEQILSLPVYPGMGQQQVDQVVSAIQDHWVKGGHPLSVEPAPAPVASP